ncbi:Protein of unknown function [Sphingomonas guangdongensis]|uniref:DUF2974 domain-containing protein n=1 Tax=Sphingomonas guangdongensis TaxID=1141890 RepID=A0A285QYB1_9SPHN|nr:DUF2974 domain-containing protein [Sphingomonas guangdongensis]SOB86458.1 Protein of unknown function [Sphingomonas guangdongensis]
MLIDRIEQTAIRRIEPAGQIDDPARLSLSQAQASVPPRELAAWNAVPPPTPPVPVAAASGVTSVAAARGVQAPDPVALAEMAQDVYNDVPAPPPGFRVASDAELAAIGVDPAQLTTRASGYRARAYVSGTGESAQVVIAFRGTAGGSDWVADARQAVGLGTDHYRQALALGRQVARSGAANVTFTGHSLGGGLASAAGLAAGREATTFNAAGLSDATIGQADAIRTASRRGVPDIRAYYVSGEILSALQDGGDRVAGALIGHAIGGISGGVLGAQVDAPEAYGHRIELDAVAPEGKHFWERHAVDKHGMDWVLASLRAQ